MTIERIYLCTCLAMQYRDGIIIQISAPRDDIEFWANTIYNILVENSTFDWLLKRFSYDFPFSLGSRLTEINRMVGHSGDSPCLLKTRVEKVLWVMPMFKLISRTSMTTLQYSRKGSTSATSLRTAPQVCGKLPIEAVQRSRLHFPTVTVTLH